MNSNSLQYLDGFGASHCQSQCLLWLPGFRLRVCCADRLVQTETGCGLSTGADAKADDMCPRHGTCTRAASQHRIQASRSEVTALQTHRWPRSKISAEQESVRQV